jgi:hypothetical protein
LREAPEDHCRRVGSALAEVVWQAERVPGHRLHDDVFGPAAAAVAVTVIVEGDFDEPGSDMRRSNISAARRPISRLIFSRVPSLTFAGSLKKREAVDFETPASRATSFNVDMRRRGKNERDRWIDSM